MMTVAAAQSSAGALGKDLVKSKAVRESALENAVIMFLSYSVFTRLSTETAICGFAAQTGRILSLTQH